ncbi:MAG: efflux RND transporter periplasmic adaptor subunit [Planctomyces sp.]|nr:efflux RND transporter periplasmic adaptor subunit [Planctomyces sp.]
MRRLIDSRWMSELLLDQANRLRRCDVIFRSISLITWAGMSMLLVGCGTEQVVAPQSQPAPSVKVAGPQVMTVTDYEYFTGRVEASSDVEIRCRVTGFVESVHYEPGTDVEKGQLLVTIDKRPLAADLARSEALLVQANVEAERKLIVKNREEKLRKENASSEDSLLQATADYDAAVAAVALAKADVEASTINLGYCEIRSPLSGRIGDTLVDAGDLVTGGPSGVLSSTLIATVVSIDDVKVSFEIDENTVQRLQQMIRDGRLTTGSEEGNPVEIGLAIHGDTYPLSGILQFVNNTLNPQTGTILLKAIFSNPKPDNGPRMLTPGMFVRVRLPLGKPREVMMVPESALMSSKGQRMLYLVGAGDKAERVFAVVGAQLQGMREIVSIQAEGSEAVRQLTADDRVIVRGLQRVRTGEPVVPETEQPAGDAQP